MLGAGVQRKRGYCRYINICNIILENPDNGRANSIFLDQPLPEPEWNRKMNGNYVNLIMCSTVLQQLKYSNTEQDRLFINRSIVTMTLTEICNIQNFVFLIF